MNNSIRSYGERTKSLNVSMAQHIANHKRLVASSKVCGNCKRYVPNSPGKCPVCGSK